VNPDSSFYGKPEHETCQLDQGCQNPPAVRIHCETEGFDLRACSAHWTEWRERAARDGLERFCPRCAGKYQSPGPTRVRQLPFSPLTGAAADAINAAMHAEGLLQDVRIKVLQRLAKDASWLANSHYHSNHEFLQNVASR
jgi:hypothetical protein